MDFKCNDISIEKKLGSIACTSTSKMVKKDLTGYKEDKLVDIKGAYPQEKLKNMDTGKIWTQMFIPEVLCLPSQKPDIEQLISINCRVEIISQRVIKTPVGKDKYGKDQVITNNEGANLTGRKLVIEGMLRQKIIYTADLPEQSMHSSHFDVPFSTFIILPIETSLVSKFNIKPCIEDIFVNKISERQIFKNITLFIKATEIKCK